MTFICSETKMEKNVILSKDSFTLRICHFPIIIIIRQTAKIKYYSTFHTFLTNSRSVGLQSLFQHHDLCQKSSVMLKQWEWERTILNFVRFFKWLPTFNYETLKIKREIAFGKLFQVTEHTAWFSSSNRWRLSLRKLYFFL